MRVHELNENGRNSFVRLHRDRALARLVLVHLSSAGRSARQLLRVQQARCLDARCQTLQPISRALPNQPNPWACSPIEAYQTNVWDMVIFCRTTEQITLLLFPYLRAPRPWLHVSGQDRETVGFKFGHALGGVAVLCDAKPLLCPLWE